jgi:hypothetical protein
MRDAARALMAAALLVGGCSTVADEPPPECEENQDCGEGLICSIAQGSICVPEVQPPRANLGFDIRENFDEFRIELHGCDPEVSLEPGGSEVRVRSRDRLAREFEFSVRTRRDVETCETCEVGSICDPDALTCTSPVEADLELGQNSRFGLDRLVGRLGKYTIPIDPPLPEGELPPAVAMVWPQYDSEDASAHWATQLEITPLSMPMGAARATLRRVIAGTVEGAFELVSTHRCQRNLFGDNASVRLSTGAEVVGADVEFLYDESIAAPSTVIGPPQTCSDDVPCPLGWACSDLGTCALDLTNVSIGKTTTVEDLQIDFLPVPLYTYCEGIPSPADDPLVLELFVRVLPPVEMGLPQVVYRIDQPFPDPVTPASSHSVPLAGTLCLPPWQPPHTIGFSVVGEPVELADTELGAYRCCSTDCLPTQATDVEPIPPPDVDTCTGFDRVQFNTLWFLDDEDDEDDVTLWGIACGGTQPTTNSDGANGRYSRVPELTNCIDTPCTVDLTHGEDGEVGRLYDVAILQPQGSVFRSRREQVIVEANTLEFSPFELEPRVLLRGSIACEAESGDDCNFANAVVAVERLRVATDETNPLGPFFFEGTSDAAGSFVLPVEPGVYVITAYPAIGQPGGPAPLQILDLRSDSAMVETPAGGPPTATLDQPLELDEGVLVRALLKDFDVNTGVVPLDVGSWTSDPAFEGFDLNSTATCYGNPDTAAQGCLIRKLRPTNTSISLLLSKQFQFTARTGPSDPCPE